MILKNCNIGDEQQEILRCLLTNKFDREDINRYKYIHNRPEDDQGWSW